MTWILHDKDIEMYESKYTFQFYYTVIITHINHSKSSYHRHEVEVEYPSFRANFRRRRPRPRPNANTRVVEAVRDKRPGRQTVEGFQPAHIVAGLA